jgi:capsular polysaccharide biosynthesis protein
MQAGVQSDGRLGSAQATSAGGADRGAFGRALCLIGGLTLLAAAIAFAVVNFIAPRYKSEAWVLIETRENIFFRPGAEKTLEHGTTVDHEAMSSQAQLILSRDLAREVIKKLKLAERPEFDPILGGPSLLRTVLALTRVIKDPMEMTPEERVFKSYYERLRAFQVEKSRVIAIEFESQDPELAAKVANAIAGGLTAAATDARMISTATVWSRRSPCWRSRPASSRAANCSARGPPSPPPSQLRLPQRRPSRSAICAAPSAPSTMPEPGFRRAPSTASPARSRKGMPGGSR